jgi:iron complex transport system substrate-binding protein
MDELMLIKTKEAQKFEMLTKIKILAAGCLLCTFLLPQVSFGSNLNNQTGCGAAPDPSSIVVAGGSITEILFLLGEEERIVAVDRTSNYPTQAANFPVMGYVRALSAEGVLSLAPSLVLGEDDMGPIEVISQLESTGISIRRIPEKYSAPGIVDKIVCVAEVLGYSESARAQIRRGFVDQVEEIVRFRDQVVEKQRPKVAVIMALRDGVPFAAGDNTSANGILEMAGGENVFSGFQGWKPVSLELMIGANPSIIIMPERGLRMSGGREAVLSHPSVRVTAAGKNDGLIAIDGMTLLGFGPRTLQASIDLSSEFARINSRER